MTMQNDQNQAKDILLVEDEESLAVGLRFNLTEEGYTVHWVKDGKAAVQVVGSRRYDLIILDVMLPFLDGFEVVRKIRQNDPKIPVLMLTARTRMADKVKGLELGVDDYVTKPFNLEELLLRIRGMLRRQAWYQDSASEKPRYTFGPNQVNFDDLHCQTAHAQFRLTPREAMVLKYLIDHHGKIVSRQELLENVWGISSEVQTRTVDNFIARLRKYFEEDPAHPQYIRSVRSAGYMFHMKGM